MAMPAGGGDGGEPPGPPPTCAADAADDDLVRRRIPLLHRQPLHGESEAFLDFLADINEVPGRREPRHARHGGWPRFVPSRAMTTGGALHSLRDRVVQAALILKQSRQPMEPASIEQDDVRDAAVDLLHEAACLLGVVEMAVFEEHDFQVKWERSLY
ncbi:hypothetical protein CDN99_09005 [Roseateles aquatilis]|uniref:Uncharacterized protein n=2 Tax=Roseateles aquatilis TaxID=431061 RepID=A0A246JF49_9BURK|nr:hypothetical protein CDN99_09005 [Roseateles aquatilis]